MLPREAHRPPAWLTVLSPQIREEYPMFISFGVIVIIVIIVLVVLFMRRH